MMDHHEDLLTESRKELESKRRDMDYWKWWAVRAAEEITGKRT